MSESALPRGPSAPPLWQTLRWLVRPVELMESCRRRFGDAFSLTFLGFESPMVLLSDPEVVRELYSSSEHTLPPGRTVSLLPVMGPSSLLLLEGDQHLERRRLMLPPFHGERLRAYGQAVAEIADAEIERWPDGGEIVIHERMRAITLEAILRVVFGVTDEARRERLRAAVPAFLAATSSVSLSFRVLLAGRLGRRSPLERLALRDELDALLFSEIAERRASGASGEDVLSLLLNARFADGSTMSDRELRDHLMTLLLAGHETTATALAWTFELLLRNPPALRRLRESLAAGEEAYLRAVISESLRLRPVVPMAGRRLACELTAGGLRLPAGTDVTPAIWLLHTRPDVYPDPYLFRPERFLDGAPATFAWLPFGGGVRRCLGAAFAELEMRVVLEAVLARVALEPVGRAERIARRNVTLAPARGARARTARRLPSPEAAAPRAA
ncbi:MAG TPA: cytochrome P450 [Solirubrobacteraceae bacterium]|nr:cytochrome P450 [Solirubrobacteraceae bacterium]